jgi:uncharacterized protein YgiM (DUF1202 family)
MKRGEVGALLGGESGEGLEKMELSGGKEIWVMKRNSVEEIVSEESTIGALFAKQEGVGSTEGGMKFVGLASKELAKDGAGGDWGEEIALGASTSLA